MEGRLTDPKEHVYMCVRFIIQSVEVGESCKATWEGTSMLSEAELIKSGLFIEMITSLLSQWTGHSAEDGL